jgi:hypothetical protein
MPIRFRCAYCNQLMGIATRKSGTVVRCPRCAGEVIVPLMRESQPANGPGRLNQAFEAEDFGQEFAHLDAPLEPLPNPLMPPPPYAHMPLAEAEASAPVPVPSPPADTSLPYNVSRTGLFLTPPMLIGIGVALLGLIGVAFLLGFFLGHSM